MNYREFVKITTKTMKKAMDQSAWSMTDMTNGLYNAFSAGAEAHEALFRLPGVYASEVAEATYRLGRMLRNSGVVASIASRNAFENMGEEVEA